MRCAGAAPKNRAEHASEGALQQEGIRADIRRNHLGGWAPKQMRSWHGRGQESSSVSGGEACLLKETSA